MANKTPWAERSGSERRTTFSRFAILYAIIAAIALLIGWFPIAIAFGLGAVGLAIWWRMTDPTPPVPVQPRAKPDWMLAMDDPDAPDLSRPEYRTRAPQADTAPVDADAPTTSPAADHSPFDRPQPTGEEPATSSDRPGDPPVDDPDVTPPATPMADPPSPTD